jgi:hypothetical protein
MKILLFSRFLIPTSYVLSAVGAGRARDEAAALQLPPKCRGHGPLLRCHCKNSSIILNA